MKMLVAVDLSASMEDVLLKAEEVAGALSADVLLMHVIPPVPDFAAVEAGIPPLRDLVPEDEEERRARLSALAASHFANKGLSAEVLLEEGPLAKTILAKAKEEAVGMIVVGSHGHGAMYHLLVGGVCEGVIHKAHCPVLVVPTHDRAA